MSARPGKAQDSHKILPAAEDLEWHTEALCRQIDVGDLFFPDQGGSTREAKRVCVDCPVRLQCLNYALERKEPFGIWGGLSERERRRVLRGETVPVLGDLRPCGTVAAFQRHVRSGEDPCEACVAAKNDASRRWSQAKARQRFRARSLGEPA